MTSSEIPTRASSTATGSAERRKGPRSLLGGGKSSCNANNTHSLLPAGHRFSPAIHTAVLCFISETKIFIRITTELRAFLQREEIQTRRANGLKTRDEFKRIQPVVFCSHSRNTPFAKQNNIASVSYFFPFSCPSPPPRPIGSCFSWSHL